MHDAGVPPGVFNMINGDGPSVGQIMAGYRNVDIVLFTGSTQAGAIVAKRRQPIQSNELLRSWAENQPTSSWKTPISKMRSAKVWKVAHQQHRTVL